MPYLLCGTVCEQYCLSRRKIKGPKVIHLDQGCFLVHKKRYISTNIRRPAILSVLRVRSQQPLDQTFNSKASSGPLHGLVSLSLFSRECLVISFVEREIVGEGKHPSFTSANGRYGYSTTRVSFITTILIQVFLALAIFAQRKSCIRRESPPDVTAGQ